MKLKKEKKNVEHYHSFSFGQNLICQKVTIIIRFRIVVGGTLGLSYAGTGVGLGDPCGPLPSQDILCFYVLC